MEWAQRVRTRAGLGGDDDQERDGTEGRRRREKVGRVHCCEQKEEMTCAMPARVVSAGVVVSAHVLSMGSPSPSDDGESLSDVSAGALSSSVARRGPDSTTVGTLGVDDARPPPPPPAAAAAALPAEAGNAERGLSFSSSSPENSACPGAGSRRENDRRLASSGSSGGTAASTHPSCP
jgi:hypothetical protein